MAIDTVRIMGGNYKVDHTQNVIDQDGTLCFGVYQQESQTIGISRKLTDEKKVQILIHEIIEVGNDLMDWELPHKQISALDAFFYQVLVDNGVDLSPLLRIIKGVEKDKSTARAATE